jgi:hypothetical protein
MSKNSTIGAGIALDGEKEFKKALAEINQGLRVTASELTLVTAKYSDNAASVSALTAKNIALENRISGQTEKVQRLREALEHSANTYGESNTKTLQWQKSLNLADAELIKMQKELKANSDELKNAEKSMKKYGLAADDVAQSTSTFGNKLGDVINSLGINLPAGADNAIRALDGQKASTMALIGVTVGLVIGLAKVTIETAKMADEIMTLSKVSGLSTDTIQEMNYASELVDVSADTMTGAMSKMIRSMDKAKGGSKEAKEAFKELHLSITNNGQLKNSEQMFYDIIDALGKMTNETERDALSMKIFGKSAQELNPLIEAGSGALKEYGAQAKAMGYVMDTDALESFGKLDDAMQLFSNQSKAFKNSIAMVILPILTSFFEVLNKIDPKILATVAILAGIAVVGITVAKAVGDITSTFSAMNPAALKTTAIVVGVVAGLIALAAIIAVIVGKSNELNNTMAGIGNSVGNMTNTVNGAGNRIGRNAQGTNNWRGGLTWVGEEGPELIDAPQGSKIYSNRQSIMLQSASQQLPNGDTFILNVDMDKVGDVQKLINTIKELKQTRNAGRVVML